MGRTLTVIARVALFALGLFVGLIGLAMWAFETDKGGSEGVDGYRIGYLPDGTAEVRDVSGADFDGAYEIQIAEDGRTVARWIDAPDELGAIGFESADADEVRTWLDRQGPVVFTGTLTEVDTWLQEQRASARDYTPAGLAVAVGAVLLIAAVVPWRRRTRPEGTGPSAPVATPTPHAG